MSNKSRQDPYRRKPPSIDLTSAEFQRGNPGADTFSETSGSASAGEPVAAGGPALAGETAIEPMATTGLDAPSPESASTSSAEPAASVDPALEPASPVHDPAPPEAEPAEVIYDSRTAPTNDRPSGEADTLASLHAGESTSASALSGLEAPDTAAASSAPEPARAEPARPEPSRTARRGFGSLLAASLIGGVVGAGIVIGTEQYLDQTPDTTDGRLAALEGRPSAPQADTGALERRIAALETGTRGLAESVAAARTASETASRQPAASPAAPPIDEVARRGLEQVTARLGTLDSGVKTVTDRVGGAATAQAVTEIGTRVSALQETNRGLQEGLKAAQEGLRTSQEGLRASQEGARQAGVNAGAITDLRTRLDALATQTQDQAKTGSAAFQALQAKSQDQDTRLGALSQETAKLPPALMQAGLRAIVAGQIADSLRGGAAIGAPLGALEKLGVPPASLDALKPYAAAPPPSAPTLAAEFRPLAEKITAEPRVAADSFGDKLLRIAEKVVTVRAVGDGSGSDQPALVARIEAALNRGALADAATTWDALPETAKGLSSAWAGRLKARVAADAALRQISADSLSALNAPSR